MPTAMGFTGVFARSVAMGSSHRCLVTRDDDVHCWGTGGSGQLGDGLSTPYSATLVRPTYAGGAPLTDVAEVSLGFSHTCALKRDGTVACWGASDLDAIANGGNPSAVVRDVPGVTTAVSLATGTYHTCVALADGTAACWGALTGVGSGAAAASPTPVVVPGLTNVARVAAGDGVTCAHLRNRNLLCWGYAGTVDESYVPRTVALPDVTAVAAGRHTCALVADGSVECWGTNQYGQLGVGHNNAINSGPNPGVSTVVGGNVFFTP
jgi:alpha-tubulin suppressor-like RCC1 family protein